tara:strand:- start:803 stop:997 length:195 start_codon:yes stop_codon:yes gene_type:complete
MKSELNELNFVSRFLDKIRKGVIDSQMKKMIKDDPELAKRTKAFKKMEKDYEDFLKNRAKRLGL